MTAALVKEANRVSPRDGCRRVRYRLRRVSAKVLPRERVARCGHRDHSGYVDIRHGDHGAYYAGVVKCGSVWTCPVCAAQICEVRRQEVGALIDAHRAAGGAVYMAAFTVPHQRIQTAYELRSLVSTTFRKLQAGKAWQRNKQVAGLMGMVRALEVTYGENGWHPHLHVLFCFAPGVGDAAIRAFGEYVFDRWRSVVSREGYGEPSRAVWQFERAGNVSGAADYVTKWGADRELTQGHTKRARGGGRTPWALLEDADAGDPAALMAFREFGHAFKGARQLTWSRGLREAYGLREPKPDADAAFEDIEERAPSIGVLPRHVWREVWRRGLACGLLEAVEAAPAWSTVVSFLRGHGVDVWRPPDDDAAAHGAAWAYRAAAGSADHSEGAVGRSGDRFGLQRAGGL